MSGPVSPEFSSGDPDRTGDTGEQRGTLDVVPPGDLSAHVDLSNVRISEFLLLRRLGSGGMSDVYLAEQTSLGRQVAVKILKRDSTSRDIEVQMKRFEQEARAAGGLSHPNLVQVITTGREGDICYIVQEYVPGLNLSQWLRKHGCPDYRCGLQWMQQIASALRAAAEAGIVHRDVKPENIMLTRNGTAKVTDFGLAQLNQTNAPRMNLTQAGTTMGTPWYMSPEQIQGTKLDSRSDQYSFGVTCYHMFAGQPPFPGKNAVTVAVRHLKEEPVSLSSLRGDLPRQLCDVIHRMMSKSPEDRFQTPAELESALIALNSVPVGSDPRVSVGFLSRLRIERQELRKLAVAMSVMLLITFLAVRRVNRPVQLPRPHVAAADTIPQESTALRQYAVAMLQPDRRAAWEAVIRNFPDTPEADLAELRLGIALMSGVVPDPEGAYEVFERVRSKGQIIAEKSHLELLGMLGQACALKELQRYEEFEGLITRIKSLLLRYDGNLDVDLDLAPVELRELCHRLQSANEELLLPRI